MDMVKAYDQYEVYWISLDPTRGSEISKTRPCVIVSPNELNQHLRTVIVAPVTSTLKDFPWRIACKIANKDGAIAADQIRTVDKTRLGARISKLSKQEIAGLKQVLWEMLIN
jgi:mRNA interferase MazF